MKVLHNFFLLLWVVIELTACGGTGQGKGTPNMTETEISGLAIDGYLAGSTCYLDVNNNFSHEAIEPSAITDSQGYFTYNPNTDTNYCREDASIDESLFCLKTFLSLTEVVLRCEGGIDLLTETPFVGSIATRLSSVAAGNTVQNEVISPLTTLLALANSETEQQQVLTALNVVDSAALKVDYIADANANLTSLALRIQKIAEVLAEPILAAGEAAEVLPVSQVLYEITQYIVSESVDDMNNILTDAAVLAEIAAASATRYRTQVTVVVPEEDRPSFETVSSTARELSARRAKQVNDVAEDICIDRDVSGSFTPEEINSCMRMTQVIVDKSLDELDETTVSEDASVETAVNCLLTSGCEDVLMALENDDFDLSRLAQDDFSDPAQAAEAASIAEDAVAFNTLSGLSLRINDPDNYNPSKQKHARVEFFFSDGGSGFEGDLTACLRYIEGEAASHPTTALESELENGNSLGAHLHGRWQVVGAGRYTLLLRLEISGEGSRYDVLARSAGTDSNGNLLYRFDFDDGLENWLSTDGLIAPSTLPTTDVECETRFNSINDAFVGY